MKSSTILAFIGIDKLLDRRKGRLWISVHLALIIVSFTAAPEPPVSGVVESMYLCLELFLNIIPALSSVFFFWKSHVSMDYQLILSAAILHSTFMLGHHILHDWAPSFIRFLVTVTAQSSSRETASSKSIGRLCRRGV